MSILPQSSPPDLTQCQAPDKTQPNMDEPTEYDLIVFAMSRDVDAAWETYQDLEPIQFRDRETGRWDGFQPARQAALKAIEEAEEVLAQAIENRDLHNLRLATPLARRTEAEILKELGY